MFDNRKNYKKLLVQDFNWLFVSMYTSVYRKIEFTTDISKHSPQWDKCFIFSIALVVLRKFNHLRHRGDQKITFSPQIIIIHGGSHNTCYATPPPHRHCHRYDTISFESSDASAPLKRVISLRGQQGFLLYLYM